MERPRIRKCPRCAGQSLARLFDGSGFATGELRCTDCGLSAPLESPAWYVLAAPRGSVRRPVMTPPSRPRPASGF